MSPEVQSRFQEPTPVAGWPPNHVDLHSHSDRSDGVLPPAELYRQMTQVGLEIAALADHDTLAGYRLLRDQIAIGALPLGPRLIAATEINSVADRTLIDLGIELEEGELHILGFGVDADDGAFEAKLDGQRNARQTRLLLMIERLRELGVPIDDQIAPALASDEAVGRPHVARAMVAAGHVDTVQHAFDEWIDRNGPAYVPRQGMRSREAIDAILAAGGIPVLAHYPAAPEQPTLIKLLMEWGVRGLEVYYRRFLPETIAQMAELATRLGLLATGGSDYHGDTMSYVEATTTTFVPREAGERLLAALTANGVPAA
ncbi:MAG: PHP domain-containing protein [Chloroflexota bacterium]|nr:PHP domain-containing protein [Chloroflexota bacterium]